MGTIETKQERTGKRGGGIGKGQWLETDVATGNALSLHDGLRIRRQQNWHSAKQIINLTIKIITVHIILFLIINQ